MVYPEFIYLFINLFHANVRIYFIVFPALCNKQKQLPEVFRKKAVFKKSRIIHRKIPMLDSIFNKFVGPATLSKRDSSTGVFL